MMFFFNDTATTEIYTLSLHDALPISQLRRLDPARAPGAGGPHDPRRPHLRAHRVGRGRGGGRAGGVAQGPVVRPRSEEHTSELQSRQYLVCRLLLEKKK